MPKHLDPARAASAPETDIVRALYEGLTEIDPATLQAVPGVAEKWEHSEDFKTWTFTLREGAKWSNGKPVTASDFVNSWARLVGPDSKAAHQQLLENFAGLLKPAETEARSAPGSEDFIPNSYRPQVNSNTNSMRSNSNTAILDQRDVEEGREGNKAAATQRAFRAEDARTLVVNLLTPDRDLPRLVANPIFRPVYGDGSKLEGDVVPSDAVTNGAFKLVSVEADSLGLERSENYWNKGSVELERVQFVPKARAEDALQAYHAGELDAVTNAGFEPLALKILEPYEDFRKNTFAALNYYKVNAEVPPFSDRRVRQALAMSIERERLTDGDLAGSTRPALSFLPFPTRAQTKLTQDKERARDLLEEAGFREGEQFPVIRLVVNRNDTQQRVARSVARMWKQNLNLETEIIVKETEEMSVTLALGDFDLIRRGVVLPTADERAGLRAIFEDTARKRVPAGQSEPPRTVSPTLLANSNVSAAQPEIDEGEESEISLTEEIAIYELEAIPLYFPTSYSLVKPYVLGFEMNVLDAPLLQNVRIDNSWQPKASRRES